MLIQKPRIPLREIILIGLLPNFLKILFYRIKGYRIGKGVRLGIGAVVCGEKVVIGDHSHIGFFSVIRGKEIRIDRYVQIGSTTFIDTPHIQIGEGTKINEQVFVGGMQYPDSRLVVGRNCQIMQMTFINPTTSVTIGDDTGIGGHCLIFGHTSWLSSFEGYPVEFKPIEIGKSVSVAWGAFLLPGTRIGDGAVIGAKSMVSREIPPRCLAVGYPVRVVSKYPDFPREVSAAEKADMLRSIVEEMIAVFTSSGLSCSLSGDVYSVSQITRKWLRLRVQRWTLAVRYDKWDGQESACPHPVPTVLVSLSAIPGTVREQLRQKRTLWIDIESKEQADLTHDFGDEVLLFFKRYGVRLFRV